MIAEPSTPPAPVARARRASRFAALAGAAVLALAGCGAGQISETAVQHPTVGGSNADLGRIALRNMQIEAPSGGSWDEGDTVALTMSIVNNTGADDNLIGITTDAADEVLIFADGDEYLAYLASQAPTTSASSTGSAPAPSSSSSVANPGVSASPTPTTAGATETPTGSEPNANQSTDPSATSGTSASSSATPSPSASSSTSAAAAPSGEVTVPSNEAVHVGYDATNRPVILLVGLKAPIGGGSSVDLTFTFATAGAVTAAVPVALTEGGADDSPTLDLHHEAGMGDEDE